MKLRRLLLALALLISGISFSQYQITGNAIDLGNDTFQLTPATNWQNGAVWYKLKHNFNLPFSVYGRMYFGDTDAGADGIVFTIQNECLVEGISGGGIGYQNFPGSSIGVEFDTYENIGAPTNDPAYDHIGVHLNGSIDHLTNLVGPVQMHPVQTNVEDGNWYTFQVDYDPGSTTLDVYFDGSLRATCNIDIVNTVLSASDPYAYWGFTSATGGSFAANSVVIDGSTGFLIEDTTICMETTTVTLPPLSPYNAAENQVATASSVEGPFVADLAFDGDMLTRWSSAFSDPQWVSVDLGAPIDVDSVILYWEGAYGLEYIIQTSTDNVVWTDQYHEYAGNGGTDQIIFSAPGVRYVRMYGLQRGTPYGYSLWEFEVYSTGQYAWAPNDGSIDDTTSTSPTFSPTSTTTYTLTIPDPCLGATLFDYTITVDCSVLPVELLSFTGELNDRQVDLYWQTVTEINNDYFIVQRSLDAAEWENIGIVDGAGNSTQQINYMLTDENLDWSVSGYYYRLRQVDFNGSAEYSNIVYIPLNLDTEFSVFPNPAEETIHIVGKNLKEEDIKLYNVLGALIADSYTVTQYDMDHVEVDISNLAVGTYVINARSHNEFFIKR